MKFELTLSPGQQRSAALLLLAVPLLLVVFAVTVLARSWLSHREEVAVLTSRAAAYRGLLSDAPALRNELAKVRAIAGADYLFPGGQTSAAAGQMQAKVNGILSGAGATIQRVTVELKADGDNSPVKLHATVSFSADIAALTRILYQLHQARPLLFVTQLAVHGGAVDAPLAAPNRLQVDLLVEAYLSAP